MRAMLRAVRTVCPVRAAAERSGAERKGAERKGAERKGKERKGKERSGKERSGAKRVRPGSGTERNGVCVRSGSGGSVRSAGRRRRSSERPRSSVCWAWKLHLGRDSLVSVTAPGALVTVTAPGASVTVPAPGASVTVPAPGAAVTVPAPGASVTATAPGASLLCPLICRDRTGLSSVTLLSLGEAQRQDQPGSLIMLPSASHDHLPKAEPQMSFSAPPMSQDPGALYAEPSDASSELEEREFHSVPRGLQELPGPQGGSAAAVTLWPGARGATCPRQEGAAGECAGREDVEKGLCGSDGSVKEPLNPRGRSTARTEEKRTLRGCVAPVEWIRSHPRLTLALLALLLLLAVVFGLSLAAVSGRTHTETPVTPVPPDTPQLLACPKGWVGYLGMCYFLSKDHRTWDQAQAQCSELGASLAIPTDEEMEFLFRLTEKSDHWLGLRRRDQGLQWEDGSSFNSSVPVLGTLRCLFLAENRLRSEMCSSEMCYVCSRAQSHL